MASAPVAAQSQALGDETFLQNYTLGQEIGRGSFANVYLGTDKHTGEVIAIKAVKRDKLTKKLLENLESEIAILKGIRHDHVVGLVDCQATSLHIHLIMEYCSLGDLSNYIKKRDKLPQFAIYSRNFPNPSEGGLNEYVARHYLKQLASAIHFMRSQNLIHRDVKPQNLLLHPPSDSLSQASLIGDPSLPILKLADFGFARFLPSTGLAETLCGSPLYMAPEILRFEKYDAKADLWSVGTVLYEMIVGKPPFRAHNHVELLRKIEKGQDKIKFPDEIVATSVPAHTTSTLVGSAPARVSMMIPNSSGIAARSPIAKDIKDLLRLLLKRNPTERISFDDFFKHSTISDDLMLHRERAKTTMPSTSIPARKPPDISPQDEHPRPATFQQQYFRQAYETSQKGYSDKVSKHTKPAGQVTEQQTSQSGEQSSGYQTERLVERHSIERTERQQTGQLIMRSTERSINQQIVQTVSQPEPILQQTRQAAMERPGKSLTHQATTQSVPKRTRVVTDHQHSNESTEKSNIIRHSGRTGSEITRSPFTEKSKRAEEDVLFEREYVVVEKRTVEVNALADEFAALPRLQTSSKGVLPYQGTTRVASRSPPAHTSNVYDPSASRRSSLTVLPPVSPNYFLNATPPFAVTTTTTKLSSRSISTDQISTTHVPPRTYSPSSSPSSALTKALSVATARLFGHNTSYSSSSSSPPPAPLSRLLTDNTERTPQNAILLFSDRSKTPVSDSNEMTVINRIEDLARKSFAVFHFADEKFTGLAPPTPASTSQPKSIKASSNIPNADSIALSSEEALVLYLKALSLLQCGVDTAKRFWNEKRSNQSTNKPLMASSRLNNAVQWTRDRFNECLEKAEFVKSKCLIGNDASSPTMSILFSNGIFAEKLIYDKALEMSRAAAVNELVGEDLDGCEQTYELAIWMLKSILEQNQEPGEGNNNYNGSEIEVEETGNTSSFTMDVEDVKTIGRFVTSINARLSALRKKRANAGLVRDAIASAAASSSSSPSARAATPSSPVARPTTTTSLSSSLSRRGSTNTKQLNKDIT